MREQNGSGVVSPRERPNSCSMEWVQKPRVRVERVWLFEFVESIDQPSSPRGVSPRGGLLAALQRSPKLLG